MKRSLPLLASALLFFAGTGARADQSAPGPIAWTYNFTPSVNSVAADPPGSGGVSFTNEPTKSAINNSDVVVTNLRDFSTATTANPDKFSTNGAYSVTLVLTDSASGEHATLTFTGKLGGTFSANNSNITNTWTSQMPPPLTLGNNVYTVTVGSYTPPGPPSASNAGSISAHVSVAPATGPPPVGLPEPSALVLSFVGLSLAGAAGWRQRRRARSPELALV
jgi:hypothetical protein